MIPNSKSATNPSISRRSYSLKSWTTRCAIPLFNAPTSFWVFWVFLVPMASQSDKTQIFQESDEVLHARIVSIVGNLYKVPDAVKVDEPWKVYREAVTDLQNTEVLYDRSRFLTRNHTGTISGNDTCIYGKMQHIMANGDCVNGVLWFQILAQ